MLGIGKTGFGLLAGRGFFRLSAEAAAALSIAGAATGTADALYAAFLRPVQISAGQSENDRNYRQNDDIFHGITSFHSVRTAQKAACWYSEPKKSR